MKKPVLALITFLFIGGFFALPGHYIEKSAANEQQIKQKTPGFDPRAIVVLGYLDWRQSAYGATKWPRVAFAIGDGTLLLTAAHCVDDFQITPDEPISINTVAISPYYGDVYDFEIVAIDKKADLAILKAPWPTHPALALASEEEIVAAKKILIASRPQENLDKSFHIGREIRTELLPVLQSDGENPAKALRLKGTKHVVGGWSGSPMLIPETGKITGVLGRLVPVKSKLFGLLTLSSRMDACGCSVRSIQALLNKRNLGPVALAPLPELKDIPDAEHSFNLAMDFFEALLNKRGSESFQIAKELSQRCPDSAQVHLLLAIIATIKAKDPNSSEIEFLNLAETSYKKALQLEPNNAHTHAIYGNFLKRTGQKNEALEQCNASLAIDPNNRMALFNKLTLIKPDELKDTAERLIGIEPNNPLFWFYYSSSLLSLGENEKALEAAQKAVAIDPNGKFYGCLADALTRLNRLDEAEPYFKLMTEKCGCQQCWFKYAGFLLRNRPNKLDEAGKALEKAESMSRTRKVSKENINLLKLKIFEKTAPVEAEVLASELLETSPDNGHYWFCFAGILRTLEKYQEAVEAAQKAVDLCPDRSYRPRLANCLARAGELEKAEQTYDELLRDYPERNRYWFWYAEFLVDYYPDRIDEAQEAKEKASSNPDKVWFVPAEELQELQEKIDSKAATLPVRKQHP
jgi:tetratricopeptide (TPR) repeat protein